MDYLKNGKRRTIGGKELTFIRCDRDGNVISEEALRNLGITNPTIEHIVSGVAGRITLSGDESGTFEDGIITASSYYS